MRLAFPTAPLDAAPRRRRARDASGSYPRVDTDAGSRLGDRLREVLERDRALREAAPSLDDLTVCEPPASNGVREHVAAEISAWIEAELGPREEGEEAPQLADEAAPEPADEVTDHELSTVDDEIESEPTNPACTEPIRTVTMARLLAVQGYAPRALSIYMELLRHSPNDVSLAREAATLRTRISEEATELAQASSR